MQISKIFFLMTSLHGIFSFEAHSLNLSRRVFTKVLVPMQFGLPLSALGIESEASIPDGSTSKAATANLDTLFEYKFGEEKTKDDEESAIRSGSTTIQVDANKVLFYGGVSSESCFQLQTVLDQLQKEFIMSTVQYNTDHAPAIHLHIQSSGGELLPALYLADFIENMRIPVITYVDSYAASAATILSVSGKKRVMSKNSFILIHQLSTQIQGKFSELSVEMQNLNTFMTQVKDIYLRRTHIKPDELEVLLSTDLWLNATTALALGLVDEVL